jgi:hypothetical protein
MYRHDFIDAVAEQETAVQGRYARFGQQQLLTVEVAPGQWRCHCYSNQSFTVSTVVRQRPPSSTLDSATSGTRATTSSPTFTVY